MGKHAMTIYAAATIVGGCSEAYEYPQIIELMYSGVISKRYSLTPLSKFFRRGKKQNLGNLDTKTHNSVMD